MNKKLFLFLSYFVIALACILRIVTYFSHHYYVVPDEAHSLEGVKDSLLSVFIQYGQGANFLPIYKLVIKLIYDSFSFTIPYLKLPSLIAGIASVFVFFDLSKKVFKNEIIVLCSLVFFALNYNLIYYSSQIKPYEIDVLLCLIIINFAISIKDRIITNKNLILMSLISCIFVYTSIPAVVILQLSIALLFVLNKENRTKLAILEAIVLFVFGIEYFTYISQIHSDNSLKSMWANDTFFFAPKSLSAVNALVNFSFLNFFWWDSHCPLTFSRSFLISYLLIFFIGAINFFREKVSSLLIIFPIFFFLVLSYLNIYPFCNRLIIFLIPLFILVTLKAFDYKNKKFVGIVLSILLTGFYIFHIINFKFYEFLVKFDKQYYEQVVTHLTPLNDIAEDEIIFYTGTPFWRCLNHDRVYLVENYELPENSIWENKNKIYFAYNLVDDKQENVDMFCEKLIQKGYQKIGSFDRTTEVSYFIFVKNK